MLIASKAVGLIPGLKGGGNTSLFGDGVRAIHVHAVRPPPAASSFSPASKSNTVTQSRIINTARNALTRFIGHLTAPGLGHRAAAAPGYAKHLSSLSTRVNASVRPPPIGSGFALGSRSAFSHRPGRAFVKGVAPLKPGVYDVGLGTARNFGTGAARPLVQTFVGNAPIALRALAEADLDVEKRMMKEKKRTALALAAKEKENIRTENLFKKMSNASAASTTSAAEEIDDYFSTPIESVPTISTELLIPLAPPTSSVNHSSSIHTQSSPEPHLLSLMDLRDVVAEHSMHALRVQTLFKKLDNAHVWERGAKRDAYGNYDGVCTTVKITFVGWPEWAVRDVLGDSGRGWCQLKEVRPADGHEGSDFGSECSLSTISSPPSTPTSSSRMNVDPSSSLILPRLDFSSDFVRSSAAYSYSSTSLPPSPPNSYPASPALSVSDLDAIELQTPLEHDNVDAYDGSGEMILDDSESEMSSDWTDVDSTWNVQTMSFSSAFLQRAQSHRQDEMTESASVF